MYLCVLEEEEGIEECSYVLVHNIIYGAVAYAEKLGFPPANEFLVTQYLLEEDTDEAEMMDIEFGLAGKPAVFTRNIKNADEMIAILTKSVGPGGYTIIDE